ncbi:hypothetical protein FZEAL_2560 [Fusarium zealandicum]|uniref:F-box domain-containing protein n=1 Tax=Fusarium zealandicum TaxID=1053134 RepID=A0A8H4XNF5_9HYPO|nr:hypothetical protein FZEAL_2560 [Fusarium zealandicum]
MSSLLGSLPSEIILNIIPHLSVHDLFALCLTCKTTQALAEPLLWNDIELHQERFHGPSRYQAIPPSYRPASERVYHRTSPEEYLADYVTELKAEALFKGLHETRVRDGDRLRTLTAHIRHLCTPVVPFREPCLNAHGVDAMLPVWQLLPFFTKLETLELQASYYLNDEDEKFVPEITAPPLPNLRYVKLFGNIPRAVVRWILRSGATIECLELGLLDRPISSQPHDDPAFSPLASENLAEDDDDASDYGSLIAECLVPRPLGDFLPPEGVVLPKLRHLYLGQPSDNNSLYSQYVLTYSSRAEVFSLTSWVAILQASRQTLETLVLEQRPAAAITTPFSATSVEYVETNMEGVGSELLMEAIGIVIKDQRAPFAALNKVYLYGVAVNHDFTREVGQILPGEKFMSVLKVMNIKCEARMGRWCPFDHYGGKGIDERPAEWTMDVPEEDIGWDYLLGEV